MPELRRLALLLPLTLGLAGGGALAAASAYTTLGLTGLADFGPPAFSGGSWQDGVFAPIAPPPDAYAWNTSPFGLTQASADLALLGAVAPAPGAPTVPVSGAARASADLASGRMGLAAGTQLLPVTSASGGAVSAFSAANVSAEMGEAFDVLVPFAGGAPGPVQVRLQLTLSGQVLDAVNDASVALRATLRLNHVAEGTAGVLQQVQSYWAGLVGDVITLDATLVDPTCSAALGVCGYFFSVYGALESVGAVPIGAISYAFVAAGDQILFDDGAALRLFVPADAVVTTVTTGQARAWVSAVPEPSGLALWAVGLLGLAGLGLRGRRR